METVNAAVAVGAAEAAKVQPGEVALEIGFGAGLALETAARLQPEATIIGVEMSEDMLAECSARLQRATALDTSKIALKMGDVASPGGLPLADESVNVIYHANCIYFWDPLDVALAECLRVLKPGGRMVTGSRAAQISQTLKLATPQGEGPFRHMQLDAMMAAMEKAGFANVHVEYVEAKKLPQSFTLIHSARPKE